MAKRENIYDDRHKELLDEFDGLVTELIYLEVPKEVLCDRIEKVAEGRVEA